MLRNFCLNITSLCLAGALFMVSCKKDEPEPVDPGTNTPPASPYFQWQLNGGNVVTADSAFSSQGHVIFAFKNSGGSIEVNLADLSPATYQISSSTGNQLQYMEGSTTHEGSGSFVITASTSNKLSGHFNCNLTGGSLSSITGTFSEIPKR
jgi:hypothetical protein